MLCRSVSGGENIASASNALRNNPSTHGLFEVSANYAAGKQPHRSLSTPIYCEQLQYWTIVGYWNPIGSLFYLYLHTELWFIFLGAKNCVLVFIDSCHKCQRVSNASFHYHQSLKKSDIKHLIFMIFHLLIIILDFE